MHENCFILKMFFIFILGTFSFVLFSQEWQFLGLETEKVTTLTVDPIDENIIYAGSASDFSAGKVGGLFRSTDGGAVWDTLIRGITVRDIDIHPFDNQIIYVTCGINFLTPAKIIKTTDSGET